MPLAVVALNAYVMNKEITTEMVNTFLEGHDPMKHIITIECDYMDDRVNIVYINDDGEKRVKMDDFKPFAWVKNSACVRMFGGNRGTLRRRMREIGIGVKALITKNDDSDENDRLENGYKYLFYAVRKMPYSKFLNFFTEAGTPVYEKKKDGSGGGSNEFMVVSPVEQYMIQTGRRLFKGYENYDDLKRFVFDLETQGLNPKIHAIDQIGMRTNKGLEKIITITGEGDERNKNELKAIDEFLRTIAEEKPDIIAGHNSENFDWDFLIVRCEVLGTSFADMSLKYFKHPIFKKKKESILKLGGEMEYYRPTIAWGFSVLDSLHAVRRAQALDSNMKSASLKYTTKYLNLNKPNRVYVPGNIITKVWNVTEEKYAFRENDGDWYEITETRPILDGYVLKTGRYIVERYLLDDLWETDKVELTLNESNFLVSKLLPTSFTRACTMGTAGIWKLIMLAWSYENNLAIPATSPNARFTGGLSRLLRTGYVDRIVKLDFNSLYPATILTWNIGNNTDIDHIMTRLLEYILTNREKYKELKAEAGEKANELKDSLKTFNGTKEEKSKIKEEIAKWKIEKSANDKKQLPLKILANSYFGAAGGPAIFPWGNLLTAEKTTCIGRQCLRLMISHFKSIGYTPIVGDSFTGDTPLFIKYDDSGLIDIKPICELIGKTETDVLGREYDTSEKPFKVLCRSGWMKPNYIYRHKTNKPLYEVSEGNMSVTVTEDHSLFNDKQEKIKPSEINEQTKLEYYTKPIDTDRDFRWLTKQRAKIMAIKILDGTVDRVSVALLNTNDISCIEAFLKEFKDMPLGTFSKTCQAGVQFLKKKLTKMV